jgi:deoxyribonuclease-4
MYLGAHVRSSGGVWTAIEHGTELGCEAVQFFAGSPRIWKPTLYKEADAARFRAARAASPIRFVVLHTIYLINLATTNDDFYEKSVTSLVGAVAAAEQLGAEAVVNNTRSHQGAGFEVGLEVVQRAFNRALAEVGSSPVKVLIENTAGAGGTMGVSFAEIRAIIDAVDGDSRVGVCLDTCHLHAAGYDVRTPAAFDAVLEEFDRVVGMDRLVLFHLNDSKTAFGSNRDRHDNIGQGDLGLGAFTSIVNHPALIRVPGITEVPGLDGNGPDRANMDILRGLREHPPT